MRKLKATEPTALFTPSDLLWVREYGQKEANAMTHQQYHDIAIAIFAQLVLAADMRAKKGLRQVAFAVASTLGGDNPPMDPEHFLGIVGIPPLSGEG